MTISKNLLDNGIKSIQVGVEDFKSECPKRLLSSVRNTIAGILLLYKEKLSRLSPGDSNEALVKAKIIPKLEKGNVVFVGTGRKTVDVQQIKERFKSLNINTNWSRFDQVSKIRNNIEHYYATENKRTVQELLAKSFIIIRDFLKEELEEDPLTVLGEECWNILLENTEIFEKEEKECQGKISKLDISSAVLKSAIKNIRCTNCGSSLLIPFPHENWNLGCYFSCRACGVKMSAENPLEACIVEHFELDSYIAAKEGSEQPLEECPSCSRESYVIEEDECPLCGYEREHKSCLRCEDYISLEEQIFKGLCGYCSHMLSKYD